MKDYAPFLYHSQAGAWKYDAKISFAPCINHYQLIQATAR